MDKPTSGAVDTDPTPASATDTTQGTEAKCDEKSATEQGGFYSFSDISNMEWIYEHFCLVSGRSSHRGSVFNLLNILFEDLYHW